MNSTLLATALAAVLLFNVGATLFLAWYIRRKCRFTVQQVRSSSDGIGELIWTTEALKSIVPASAILPKPGSWSLDGTAIRIIAREIEARRPELIVELGSGLSTIVMALELRQIGKGRVISIDHDSTYAEQTRYQPRYAPATFTD